MLRLIRGIHLTIDPQGRLCYGLANGLQLSGRGLTLWITLAGKINPDSGFIVNVCDIDDAFEEALENEGVRVNSVPDILVAAREIVTRKFPDHPMVELKLDLNERLSLLERQEKPEMIQVTKKYEIAAAHRLHNPKWSEQKNSQVFGKCNNSEGHGHNYQIEITLGQKTPPDSGQFDLDQIDAVVKENILDRFDHKNLNTETPEFSQLNPTVENMCRVFWEILVGRFDETQLIKVGIWETPKTYAEYDGPLNGPLKTSDTV